MLLRIIGVISLIQFLLLMVSGESINTAMYRSLLVFLILFSLVYITMFLLNIVQGNTSAIPSNSTAQKSNESQNESGEQ